MKRKTDMKKMLMMLVACVATFSSAIGAGSLEERVRQLEERLSRIERDLYSIEEKKAPPVETPKPQLAPSPTVEQKVLDRRIDAFLKEYLGVQFGDTIERFPDLVHGRRLSHIRKIPVIKKFQYFDTAEGTFHHGRLVGVRFSCKFDDKYSYDSCLERGNQLKADLAETIGLPEYLLVRTKKAKSRHESRPSYRIFQESDSDHNLKMYYVSFWNENLRDQIQLEVNASGEKLPAVRK